ncbi:hypothetical protein [Trinickia acidisoli]|nr:hypothetical protein [Trinickia acidisoli]
MQETIWFFIVGGMFVAIGITSSLFKRLPLTGAMPLMKRYKRSRA